MVKDKATLESVAKSVDDLAAITAKGFEAVHTEFVEIHKEFAEVHKEIAEIKTELKEVKEEVTEINQRLEISKIIC